MKTINALRNGKTLTLHVSEKNYKQIVKDLRAEFYTIESVSEMDMNEYNKIHEEMKKPVAVKYVHNKMMLDHRYG